VDALSWNEEENVNTDRLTLPWWALRVAFGAAAFLAGLDKFFNLLANWPAYLTPWAAAVLPLDPSAFMHIVGVIEMAVGATILLGFTRIGGYVAAAWLVCIALNLATTGRYFDIAVRDLVMAVGAFTLARLTEAGVVEVTSPFGAARQVRHSKTVTA
jgi:uncharacterized membrane protein YphA (DoxX/SURF4 family)